MATCKDDCVFYDVCSIYPCRGQMKDCKLDVFGCGRFKDKALIREIPFKIGDTVWYRHRGKIIPCKVKDIIHYAARNTNDLVLQNKSDPEDIFKLNYEFLADYALFRTKEKAEEEERKNNNGKL